MKRRAQARALPFPDEHEPEYYPVDRALTHEECVMLMSGQVPEWIADNCLRLIEWSLESGVVDYAGLCERAGHRG